LTGSRLFLILDCLRSRQSWTTISTDSNVGAGSAATETTIGGDRDRTRRAGSYRNLIPQRFTPLLEAGVALAGEVLALL